MGGEGEDRVGRRSLRTWLWVKSPAVARMLSSGQNPPSHPYCLIGIIFYMFDAHCHLFSHQFFRLYSLHSSYDKLATPAEDICLVFRWHWEQIHRD